LAPVYEKGKPIDTIEQRRKHFVGMVYSPFMGRKFMADINEISDKTINFEVYDGETIKDDNLIYKNKLSRNNKGFDYLNSITQTEFAGRVWTIKWNPNINFKPKINNNMPEIFLIVGIFITVLLSWMFYLLEKLYGDYAKKLETNRIKLDNIINNAVDGLILIDTKGIVEMYNPACEKLFGYSKKEVLGKNIKMLMPEKHSKNHDQYINNYINTNKAKILDTGREVEAKRKDGTMFPIDLSISKIKVQNKILFSGIVRDITQKKKFERSILKANKELETFTYIASHDLRSPLINIKGFTSKITEHVENLKPLLKKASPNFNKEEQDLIKGLLEEKIPKAERFIHDGVARMDNMTSAILQLSRTGRRELLFKKLNTQALVDRCIGAISHQLGKGKVKTNNIPDIIGDETSMEQIFGNLLDNAVKYLDPQRTGKLEITYESKITHHQFAIKDNGRGIADDDRDKVFAIFRRAGNVVDDTLGEGMGLNHVKTLIERHGGEIWFESKLGKGTTFFFTIDKNLQATQEIKK
jgi:PAS domain S-box-containing protein